MWLLTEEIEKVPGEKSPKTIEPTIEIKESIIKEKQDIIVNGIMYPKRVFEDDNMLKSLNIVPFKEDNIPDDRYYNYDEVVDKLSMTVSKIPIPKDISEIKTRMLLDLKNDFLNKSTRPIVLIESLGISVDGGRTDYDNFYAKWESMSDTDLTTVKCSDNILHNDITKDEVQIIYRSIFANGEALMKIKWQKEQQINQLQTIDDLILFEATMFK